ncbi:Katanin p80 WD40-containing subunit B1 [Operophtera brumata]|uniref:Katanin p80 WD40-containing subunit B1 n=1 Tax=Operophtera brumata TaxID=104452 RepID=A0A0L7LEK2_OPEBR|nr:Katanin p80 WD40-containing subunit B1 [Operophtera brumata]
MASLKEIYEKTEEYTAFYTGGEVQWTSDGAHLLCLCDDVIKIVDVSTLAIVCTIGDSEEDAETDQIYTFHMSHDNKTIITAHKSGLIKMWDRQSGMQMKMWRSSHKGPVARLAYDPTDENIASGGSDGNIRLWDLAHNTCTSSLRGAMGVFSVLKYHPESTKQLIFGAADDTKIRSWNSKNGKEVSVYSGHFSKITSLQFTPDGEFMVSSGRDRVLILWKLNETKALKVIPVYESIEGTVLMPAAFKIPNFNKKLETDGIYVACAGEKGVIKVWNMLMSKLMFEQKNSLVTAATEEGGLAVTHLMFNDKCNHFTVVTADHNIILHDIETFDCVKQMVGFTDEVLDIIFVGTEEKHIVVATNSRDLKYYELNSMNCEIIKGHTDIVLSLALFPTRPDMFVSAGKDNSVRIWLQTPENGVTCIGVGSRHTASVGSVFTAQTSNDFFASVGQDNCLKVWTVPKEFTTCDQKIKSSHTELAHQMDTNCVTVSPNDKMIATGSQDKTCKLWTEDLTLLGVLKGHRRGVWCVRFSPVDQVVLTSSADSTLKLWSIADLSCLKTFEGHESSVVKIEFISKGQQIISSGADGLLKLWSIKTSECKMSLDNHDGKVWALAISKNESTAITGGSDSKLVKLKDVTAERREKVAKEREEMILQEQELMNLLHNKKMVKALKLAIRMERPLHVLKIVNEVLKGGNEKLRETLKAINHTQKESLLKFAAQWNTNNKNCHAAQLVFNILAPEVISGTLRVPALASFIEGALPYTERHFERLTNLMQDLNFITYTVNCMTLTPHAMES